LWWSGRIAAARPERLGLWLAHPDSADLSYAGAAFIALGDDARAEFLAEVERLTTGSAMETGA